MDDKILLFNNINKSNNPDIIINYIMNNNITYSKNNNGYFINLSLLNENDINNFNIFIDNNININNEYIENITEKENIIKYTGGNDKEKNEIIIEKKKLKLSNLEKKILSYSFEKL